MVRKVVITASLSILSFGVLNCNVVAFAETSSKAANGELLPKPVVKGFQNMKLLEAEDLSTKVDLPNLPEFTGKAKFIGGVSRKEHGQNYIQHFLAKEDAKLVIDWYLNTLNMYKWKIDYNDLQSITAKTPDSTCSIFVNDISARKTGYKSEIEINYFQNQRR